MLDFGALPPEINSARIYSGPGSGPMMAAASAWDALAAQMDLYATGYQSVISTLQGQSWSGEASNAMAAAAAPYVAWATTTSGQAEQAANQARAAAAAYEAAFAATVPPGVVVANRIQLLALVATNFFGQNTPAIAATEAAYAVMWAQDAAAMYGYAAASSTAATLTPFSAPPQTTSAGGQSAQGAAVAQAVGASPEHAQTTLSQLISTLPQQLHALSTAGSSDSSTTSSSGSSPIITAAQAFNQLTGTVLFPSRTLTDGFSGGTGFASSAAQTSGEVPKAAVAAEITPAPSGIRGGVLASVSNAERVGALSVPQNWTTPSAPGPVAEPVVSAEPGFRALPGWATQPPTTTPGGMPVLGPIANGAGRRGGNAVFRKWDRRFRMPRPAVGG